MFTLKRWIAVPGILGALLLAGCGDLSGGRRVGTAVRLTGFAARHSRDNEDKWIPALSSSGQGIRIPVNCQLPFTKDVKVAIHGVADGKPQNYDALFGPDPDHPVPVVAEVHSSAATVYVNYGWVVAVGRLPMGDTGTTQTSSTGTTFVIRAETASGRDTIYHLDDGDPNAGPIKVTIPKKKEPIPVAVGYYLVYPSPSGDDPKPELIRKDDRFLAYVRVHAGLAGLPLK